MCCGCRVVHTAVGLTIATLLLLIVAWATPWYYVDTFIPIGDNMAEAVSVSAAADPDDDYLPGGSFMVVWWGGQLSYIKPTKEQGGHPHTRGHTWATIHGTHLRNVVLVSLGLLGFGTLLALAMIGLTVFLTLFMRHRPVFWWMKWGAFLILVFACVAQLMAPALFIRLPQEWKKDGKHEAYTHAFAGRKSLHGGGHVQWGPFVGWAASVLAAGTTLLAAVCVAFLTTRRPLRVDSIYVNGESVTGRRRLETASLLRAEPRRRDPWE